MKYGKKINGSRTAGNNGSSMIYVVLLVTLLAVLSSGYLAISRYNIRAALNDRRYMEAQLSAKTIHRSFCEAVSSGDSQAMDLIWRCFEEDCDRVQEEFDAMMDEEEEDGDTENEESDEDAPAEEERLTEDEDEDDDDESDAGDDRWERYLYQALGNKEYVVHGSDVSAKGDTEIDITVTALPLNASAVVHTRVKSGGYQFSMMADIVFDDRDGAVMVIKRPYRSKSKAEQGVKIYMNGNGVYRYYEGD